MENLIIVRCIVCERDTSFISENAGVLNFLDAYSCKLHGYKNTPEGSKQALEDVFLCKKHYNKLQRGRSLTTGGKVPLKKHDSNTTPNKELS